MKNTKPAAQVVFRIRHYGDWDLTHEEHGESGIQDYNFTAHTTLEMISNGRAPK